MLSGHSAVSNRDNLHVLLHISMVNSLAKSYRPIVLMCIFICYLLSKSADDNKL